MVSLSHTPKNGIEIVQEKVNRFLRDETTMLAGISIWDSLLHWGLNSVERNCQEIGYQSAEALSGFGTLFMQGI